MKLVKQDESVRLSDRKNNICNKTIKLLKNIMIVCYWRKIILIEYIRKIYKITF